LREQVRNPAIAGLDGAFDIEGRTAPAATRLEALLAALDFLPKNSGDLRDAICSAVGRTAKFLLRAQIVSGPYAGDMPGAVAGTQRASEIRIDYVQHALCAWNVTRGYFCATCNIARNEARDHRPLKRRRVIESSGIGAGARRKDTK